MCTLVILRRPGHAWPVLIGANRDEMIDRAWQAPARHWSDRAHVVAGRDELADGSWLGVNDDGLVAGILNRMGSLGPAADKRSRGEIVLDALDHADADTAASALASLDGRAYRPFNLVVADANEAFWLRHDGGVAPVFHEIPIGLSMFTAHERNDPNSPRIRHNLQAFETANAPDPEGDDWHTWEELLASKEIGAGDPREAMCIGSVGGFGTVNASLIALPRVNSEGISTIWRFADGPPDENSFEKVVI
jgi:uncharacterized protein with NRDE domain